jgi:hypothetical protein
MVAPLSPTVDVFVSISSPAEGKTVTRKLRDSGLSVRTDQEIFSEGMNGEAALRKAIVESDAFVLVVDSRQPISPNSIVELGAAMALHKPVFVVQIDGRNGAMPEFLRRYSVFPLTELHRLAESIKEACAPLSIAERESLLAAYQEMGMPSDQILSDPLAIEDFSDRFRKIAGRGVSAKHLASELLRQRKAGSLPRIRSKKTKSSADRN